MRRRFSALLVSLSCLGAAGRAAAAPQIELLPHGAIAISGDGCVVMGPDGIRQQAGITTGLEPQFHPSAAHPFARAMTSDASGAIGGTGDFATHRFLDGAIAPTSIPSPSQWLALSDDGRSVVGRHGTDPAISPFHWRDGSFSVLPTLPHPAPRGEATAVSADGSVVGGWSAHDGAPSEAVVWNAGAIQALGFLPGHDASEVTALSADGSVAVGSSGSGIASRAFRWDGVALLDLGTLTHRATGVSADGQTVVGEGPLGAFVWDAEHGTRLLADALLADQGVDVGDW
jgi:uncharacterized membrane protein